MLLYKFIFITDTMCGDKNSNFEWKYWETPVVYNTQSSEEFFEIINVDIYSNNC